MLNYRKIYILLLTVIFTVSASFLYAQTGPPEGELPESRILGDKAFKEGLFDLAIKFYNEYKEQSTGNTDAMIDACECIIAAYIHSGNAQKAREEFNYLTTKFALAIAEKPELKQELAYWDGIILMESGDPYKAADIFSKLLKTVSQKSELYLKTLDALGTAQARSLQWDKAEKTYAMLEFAGKKTKWQRLARKKKIISIVMMEDYKKAASLVNLYKDTGPVYIKVIHGIVLLKQGYLSKAMAHYKEIRKLAKGSDSLWYMLASNLALAFQEKKKYEDALFLLNDALLFAGSEFERQKTLITIMNVAVAGKNIPAAISTARRFLKSYPDSFISNDVRLELANLIAPKKPEDALQVLTEMINDKNTPLEVKIKSARDAAHIFIELKRYAEANEKFKLMEEAGKTPLIKGEGAYWIAELKFIEGKNKEAAEAFAAVAAKYPDWKEKALFREIKALMNTTEYGKSVERLELFIKEFSESKNTPDAYFLYALALKNTGKKRKAVSQFSYFSKNYPNHKYAPRSLFEEGLLELEGEKFSDAISAFTQLCEKYPDSPLVPNVLYRRIFAFFFEGYDKEAIADVTLLMAKFPDSDYTLHAQFRLADYYLSKDDVPNAIAVLDKIAKSCTKSKPNFAARALYEIADIYFREDKKEEAIKTLDDLSGQFPEEPITHNALFLRGDIYKKNQEYEKAIPFFIKAAKSSTNTTLEISAEGSAGDCYFALGDKAKDGSNYLKAIEYYNKVLAHKNLPGHYRDQALFKIGRCEESLEDKGKALSKYREVMLRYETEKEITKPVARSSVWFAKSGINAVRLYLEKGTPEGAEAAISVLKSLIKSKVEPKEDFKKKIEEIRMKYKLKE
jgi:tetratricopeptide (TPR) repeat protein